MVPPVPPWFHSPVIARSLSTRSPTRIAAALREPSTPARLAMLMPCRATGTTIAMKSSAASTSASVKARLRLVGCIGQELVSEPVGGGGDLQRTLRALAQHKARHAGIIEITVGREPDH